MLEKHSSIDQVTVKENGTLEVREAIRVLDDGAELSKTYHRYTLPPASELDGQPENVVAIANAVWTEEVVNNYRQHVTAK